MASGHALVEDRRFVNLAIKETAVAELTAAGTDPPRGVREQRTGGAGVRCKLGTVMIEPPIDAVVRAHHEDPGADVLRRHRRSSNAVTRPVPAPEIVNRALAAHLHFAVGGCGVAVRDDVVKAGGLAGRLDPCSQGDRAFEIQCRQIAELDRAAGPVEGAAGVVGFKTRKCGPRRAGGVGDAANIAPVGGANKWTYDEL